MTEVQVAFLESFYALQVFVLVIPTPGPVGISVVESSWPHKGGG